jgi:hypothetical protein
MRRWIHVLIMCLCLQSQAGAAPFLDDTELKAAFIYRFAQFTRWPPPPLTEFHYCVAGNPALHNSLRALTAQLRSEVPSYFYYLSEPKQAMHCHLLLIGFNDRAELMRWQAALINEPILVIGESVEAFRNGAIIGFIPEPNGLAFRINLTEAKRRGLVLSSHMLKLAREVK